MTVIALRDGILAADTMLATEQGLITGQTAKIGKIGGRFWAACGETAGSELVLAWILGGCEGPQPKPESGSIILIDRSCLGRIYAGGTNWRIGLAPFHAWGIGQQIALGAMHMGASARQAVEAAIAWRSDCGGLIESLEINPLGLPHE